jgi:hypothetical protein
MPRLALASLSPASRPSGRSSAGESEAIPPSLAGRERRRPATLSHPPLAHARAVAALSRPRYRPRCHQPKKAHLRGVKKIFRYLKHTPNVGLWYPKGATFDLIGYSDSDYVGCQIDRKSTSGGCHLLGRSLVSWTSKKQNSVALSTAEAEYIVVGACCTQILYMKQTLLDYGVVLEKVPLLCDNESSVKIGNNPVQHSHTKHIDIRHHFLRDHVAKGDIILEGVRSEDQLADIFTKPLDKTRFCMLMNELNILDLRNFI